MLSARGAHWAKIDFSHGKQDAYNRVHNPRGTVSFANAENWLMHDDLAQFINTCKRSFVLCWAASCGPRVAETSMSIKNHFDKLCCAYGEGYTGTLRLRTAMSRHLNAHFKPMQDIDPEEITIAAGVTDLNEVCALITCDPDQHDTIMLGRPVYGVFYRDLTPRTG
ncbi:MAG: hypothetical protein M1819_002703 [Sarea resinae]|nr:MAG: hypothetical protein M1819_002703 [Sarea resinae]